MRSFSSLFWERVQIGGPDECWPWEGGVNRHGYGQLVWGDKRAYAHRVAYELMHGALGRGVKVLHSCDVPACVNPSHLRAGTQAENMADMTAKGRQARGERHAAILRSVSPKGENHWNAKLGTADVAAIRAAVGSGESRRSIARRYCVSEGTIRHILRGRSWRDTSA